MINHKTMTLGELRDALNLLSPEQLNMLALWSGDERGGSIGGIEVLTEEFVNVGDGLEPRSSYGDELDESDIIDRHPAGTVFILSDLAVEDEG